jgi:hypothetical protein
MMYEMSEKHSPASNCSSRSSSRVGSRSSQASIADASTGWDGSSKLQDSEIVVVSAVARVDSDGRKSRGTTTRSARL